MRTALAAASIALLYGISGLPATNLPTALPTATRFATVTDTTPNFAWTGTVPAGGWLRIRNLAGTVEVRRAPGSSVSVRATRESESNHSVWTWAWSNGTVQPVRFVTEHRGSDVVVCAVSRDVPKCDPNDLSASRNSWDDDRHPQPMHVVVQLPAGVSLQAGSMHGNLSIVDAGAAVMAHSGHGDIDIVNAATRVSASTGHGNVRVSSAGAVEATTGHGDIVVKLASSVAAGSNDMMFQTGHGNISVTAPRTLAGDVDLHTGHGQVSTDFPLTSDTSDRHERTRSAHGVLGTGGRSVRLSSGHGDVSLLAGD